VKKILILLAMMGGFLAGCCPQTIKAKKPYIPPPIKFEALKKVRVGNAVYYLPISARLEADEYREIIRCQVWINAVTKAYRDSP